mmetsp:Transcript_51014/g.141196  ORF Transcript_51014/g.141196 Transcript_51014/m.141196 type:complete len:208 (+) Transcript_51014:106-729(+)
MKLMWHPSVWSRNCTRPLTMLGRQNLEPSPRFNSNSGEIAQSGCGAVIAGERQFEPDQPRLYLSNVRCAANDAGERAADRRSSRMRFWLSTRLRGHHIAIRPARGCGDRGAFSDEAWSASASLLVLFAPGRWPVRYSKRSSDQTFLSSSSSTSPWGRSSAAPWPSYKRTLWSIPADASTEPSGDQAKARGVSLWRPNRRTTFPEATS